MTQNRFYSASINSFQDFEDYLNAKHYDAYLLAEVPGEGYYAMVRKESVWAKDFTAINLSFICTMPDTHMTVFLSFADRANKSIINS